MLIYSQIPEPMEKRLLRLHRQAAELVGEISFEGVLEKTARIALESVAASYSAVATLDENGELERFIPAGMSKPEMDQIPHFPRGKGLIGEMMHTQTSIRLPNLQKDPRHAGFPPFHPQMTSFLGVPIFQGKRQIGQIYLTNKTGVADFTDDDQRIIELLAAYAGVAIVNARLFRDYVMRDRILTRQNENLSLLNQMSSTLATSTEIDQILDQGLTQLMDYLRLEVGEIFIKNEDSKTLLRTIHQG